MSKLGAVLGCAVLLGVSGCSDTGGGEADEGVRCGDGTIARDGVCVADGAGGGAAGGDSSGGGETSDGGTLDPGSQLACGEGTLRVDGECLPAPSEPLGVQAFRVTELSLSTMGRALTGSDDDPVVQTHYPLDMVLAVHHEGDPATIPVLVALGEEPTSTTPLENLCIVGVFGLKSAGTGEVRLRERLFVPDECLVGAGGTTLETRTLSPVLVFNFDDRLHDDGKLSVQVAFSEPELEAADAGEVALGAAVTASLTGCTTESGGRCSLSAKLKKSDGVDFELTQLALESSVLVLNRCFEDQAGLDAAALEEGLPTGYLCNRSIVRGVDDQGKPLPEGHAKDYTYGAADIDADTTVTSFGLPVSSLSSKEVAALGDGVAVEDITNNALLGDESYTVRYFLRPSSVVASGVSVASGLKALAGASTLSGALDTLVSAKKLLPVYLHARGEQAKADGESVGGQDKAALEETLSIPQTPTEYSHGLYVENDCGRFNDPVRRPDDHRPGTQCDAAINPRDELLYGDYRSGNELVVVACLVPAEGAALPATDVDDNNCLEQGLRVARVAPTQDRIVPTDPSGTPLEDEAVPVYAAGYTQDELFAAGDATAWNANYPWDESLGGNGLRLEAHAHSYNSVNLSVGASTDNEARLTLKSGVLDFSITLLRAWAQAEARTNVVGSYYDYGIEFAGDKIIGDRKEAEFHKEWDWNVVREWKRSIEFAGIFDVGYGVSGQVGFKIGVDVTARDLAKSACTDADCKPLREAFGEGLETVGEAGVTLTPYGQLKLRAWGSVDLYAVSAGVTGEVTVVDLSVPLRAALNWGVDLDAPALKFAAWARVDMKTTFLSGRLYIWADYLFDDDEWTIASWDGWSYQQQLWASPIFSGVIGSGGVTGSALDQNMTYAFKSAKSGQCLSGEASSRLSQRTCNRADDQVFRFSPQSDGTVSLLRRFGFFDAGLLGVGNEIRSTFASVQASKVKIEKVREISTWVWYPWAGWRQIPAYNHYQIRLVDMAACVTMSSFNSGASATLSPCNGSVEQQFVAQVSYRRQSFEGRDDFVARRLPDIADGDWTGYGAWLRWAMCPRGSFVTGYRTRLESSQGDGDDTSLNGIHLRCSDGSQLGSGYWDGMWGEWSDYGTCSSGYANGFNVRFEPPQGGGDDTGMTDLKASCTNGSELYVMPKYNNVQFGSWLDETVLCPPHTAVCGMRMLLEGDQGSGDDTAANNIEFACCQHSFPSL